MVKHSSISVLFSASPFFYMAYSRYINYKRGSAMRGKTLIQSTTNFQQSGTKGKENANPMSPSSSSSSDSYGMAYSPLSSSQVQNFALPPPSAVDLHMQGNEAGKRLRDLVFYITLRQRRAANLYRKCLKPLPERIAWMPLTESDKIRSRTHLDFPTILALSLICVCPINMPTYRYVKKFEG